MAMTQTLRRPERAPARRGWTERLDGIARALWREFERAGHRRAMRHLEMLADHHAAGNPALAEQLRAAAGVSAAALRAPAATANEARSPR